MAAVKILDLPGLLNSFGDIPDVDWVRMKRPYIAVAYMDMQSDLYREHGMRFMAKLYDGALYTGYHRASARIAEIYEDIEANHPELIKVPPGAEDPDKLICVYM